MYSRWIWLQATLLALPLAAHAADDAGNAASDTAPTTVEQRLEQTEQDIKVLERKLELADETAAAAAKTTGVIKAGSSGFSVGSADSANVIKFKVNLAVDGRFFLDQNTPSTADTFLLRRARPFVEGTVASIYDFRLMPDFGNGKAIIQDAWVNAKFKPWFNLQAGKFKGPVGLERLQPDQYNRFMELGLTSDLVPNRDLGVQIGGSLLKGTVTYNAGYFDGTPDGFSTDANTNPDLDNDGKKDWEGRIFTLPFANSETFALRGLGVGLAATYVHSTGVATSSATAITTTTLLPVYRTPGQQGMFSYRGDTLSSATINESTIANGVRRRFVPQAYYYLGPVGLLGEYVEETQQVSRQIDDTTTRRGTLEHSAWLVSASWFLTGEEASYAGFTPRSTFQPGKAGTGAWELVARYHRISFDDDSFTGGSASFADPSKSVRSAKALGGGVNWYLNANFKLQLNYEVTQFEGGASNKGDRPDEQVLSTRFSLFF